MRSPTRARAPEGLERDAQVGGGDVQTAARLGGGVEGIDLHRADALGEQALGQLVGAVDEALEVLVRALGPARGQQAPVALARIAGAALPSRAVAVAGVVDADLVAARPAEQRVDRHARGLAEQVPERDVDRGDRADLRARALVADQRHQAALERAVVQVDAPRVAAEQVGRRDLVHVAAYRLGVEAGLAEADQALVGVHAHPGEMRPLRGRDRVDGCDAHVPSVPHAHPARRRGAVEPASSACPACCNWSFASERTP